jgi:BON domain
VLDIRVEVANALHWDIAIPRHRVTAKVDDSWVTLQGVVEWAYQRSLAEADVRRVPGVTGIKNEIAVRGLDCDPMGKPTTLDEVDDLLRGRMKILGLDVDVIEREFHEVFDKIKRNCPSCSDREPCALDLKRDPNTLMWEAYCPNSDVLNALVAVTEVIR